MGVRCSGASPLRTVRRVKSTSTSPMRNGAESSLAAPALRRRVARTRASNSPTLNGLVR